MLQVAGEHQRWALFLDVDAALLEPAEIPQDVVAPESLKYLLNFLCARLEGALALMSGRAIADLDALFRPFQFCAAGVHGCERRNAAGCILRAEIDRNLLQSRRFLVDSLICAHPALLLEDKGLALALHFRRAQHLHLFARTTMKTLADVLGPAFALRAGRQVYEVSPSGWNKATALAAFMAEPPFSGRTPVFIGHDETEQGAFDYVNAQRGISIRVGPPVSSSAARYSFARVSDSIDWLRALAASDHSNAFVAGLHVRTLQ